MTTIYLMIFAFAFMFVFTFITSFRSQIKKSRIISPKLGIINYIGGRDAGIIEEDLNFLKEFFGDTEISHDSIPECDVLFLYCQLNTNGSILNSTIGLDDIIKTSRAKVIVMASENKGENYLEARHIVAYTRANIVMTVNRKGESFSHFFKELFRLMFKGKSMPQAWVKIAPQNSKIEHTNTPDTIFICKAGQVAFQK